jgi:hypothetical protein
MGVERQCREKGKNIIFRRRFYLFLYQAGTFGAILEYGVEEKITEHSSLGATMVVGRSWLLPGLELCWSLAKLMQKKSQRLNFLGKSMLRIP